MINELSNEILNVYFQLDKVEEMMRGAGGTSKQRQDGSSQTIYIA